MIVRNPRYVIRKAPLLYSVCAAVLFVLMTAGVAAAQSSTSGEYRSYPLKHKRVADVEQMLTELLDDLNVRTHLVADPQNNQILLRGPQSAQDIARQLIDSVDRAPVAGRGNAKPLVQAYPIEPAALEDAADSLRQRFRDNPDVRVAIDTSSAQLLVVAPQEIHDWITSRLNDPAPPMTAEIVERTVPRRQTPQARSRHEAEPSDEPREMYISLLNSQSSEVLPMLRQLFGKRMQPIRVQQADEPTYALTDVAGQDVEVTIDRRRNQVVAYGPESAVVQVARLVRALDTRETTEGHRIRILALRRSSPDKIEEALRAYRGQQVKPRAPKPNRNKAGDHGTHLIYDSQVRPANFAFQESDAPAGGETDAQPDAQPADVEEELDRQRERLRELGTDVEVETLPDLDVIILRGRDRDVEEMTRIINEIERLSAEAEPEIYVAHLKHIDSQQLSLLITGVLEDLVGGRQGRVTQTPLLKPNALLLIGWGEALEVLKELIVALDRPVNPNSQLRVFRLKHAPAATAQQTVQQFFANRPGLAASVRVTADPRTNSLLVQAAPRDMKEVELLIKRIDVAQSAAVQQAKIFSLKNSLADDVAQILTQAISGTGGGGGQASAVLELLAIDTDGEKLLKSGLLDNVQITPDPRKNTLVVSAPPESMELLGELIRQLDETPVDTAQIKVFRIINSDAGDLVQMLRSLLPTQTGANFDPQLPVAEGEASSLAPLRFAIDTRTNSIIATGSASDLRIIEALLLRLDEREVKLRENVVYRLKNVSAVDVARAIGDFLRSERQIQLASPGGLSAFQQIEREVVVVPEPVGNNLIVSATPRFFEEIKRIVEKLDEQPPKVMIQVLIAEVGLNDTDEFGVELGLQDSLLFDRSVLSNLADSQTLTRTAQQSTDQGIITATEQEVIGATFEPGYNFNQADLGNSGSARSLATAANLAGQALSNFAVGRTNSQLGYGGLVLSAGSDSVNILLRALHENRRLEVLSRPQVTTLDNQPAFIQVGQRVPRITGSTVGLTGTVNSVELENVGLILGVTPRISPEGMVVMEIDSEKSEVGNDADGIPVLVSTDGTIVRSPRINVITAQTTVSAADGETIILGGLITKRDEEIRRRVPWLSDLPLLGQFFQYDLNAERRTELLIILTPHVIRNQKDMERAKMEEYARMSWCATDVCELHNHDPLLCGDSGCPIYNDSVPVIYPDSDPRGEMPANTAPPLVPQPEPEGDVIYPDDNPQGRTDSRRAIPSSWDDVDPLYPDNAALANPPSSLNVRLRRTSRESQRDARTGIPKVLYSPGDPNTPIVPDQMSRQRR